MEQSPDDKTPRRLRSIFYCVTISLLMVSIAVTLIQKESEGRIARVAITGDSVHHLIEDAGQLALVSLALVALAILSLGIAIVRREKLRWGTKSAMLLLCSYVVLQLMMV